MDFGHLVQGGITGVALGLTYVVWKLADRQAKMTDQVIHVVERNARALAQLTAVIEQQSRLTAELSCLIRSLEGNPGHLAPKEEESAPSAVGGASCGSGSGSADNVAVPEDRATEN